MTYDEIRALLAGTTPGIWYDHGDAVSTNPESGGVGYPPARWAVCSLNDGEYIENTNKKDAAFIAASKSIVEQLLEENEGLRTRIHNEYAMKNIRICLEGCETCARENGYARHKL